MPMPMVFASSSATAAHPCCTTGIQHTTTVGAHCWCITAAGRDADHQCAYIAAHQTTAPCHHAVPRGTLYTPKVAHQQHVHV